MAIFFYSICILHPWLYYICFFRPSNLRSLRFSNLMISSGGGASAVRAMMPSTSAFWLPGKIPRWSPGRYLTSQLASQESLIRMVARLKQENIHTERSILSHRISFSGLWERMHFKSRVWRIMVCFPDSLTVLASHPLRNILSSYDKWEFMGMKGLKCSGQCIKTYRNTLGSITNPQSVN